jgi:hypothetical protein
LANIINFMPISHPPILDPENEGWCSIKNSEFLVLTIKSRLDDLKAIIAWYLSKGRNQIEQKSPPGVLATAKIPKKESDYICGIYTQKGEESLKQNEYSKLIRSISSYDMFIDGITKQAWKKNKGKITGPAKLTVKQLILISEYIKKRNFKRPGSILNYSQGAQHNAKQIFKTARSKVDVRIGRKEWRAFKMIEYDESDSNQYGFCPPAQLKYCLIEPLIEQNPKT